MLKRGVYVLTVKEKDGDNDRASHLDREDAWRINIGVRKQTFRTLFGELPKRPCKGGIVDMPYEFTTKDGYYTASGLCVDGLDLRFNPI